ncbi:hypothetical protein JW992_16730 [candidate division KSB1 bacterium]|nr:hypothetical protein [candidate division KSB1 bacterium]
MWIFWPFRVLWRLLTALLQLVGRLVLVSIGLVLCVIGFVLTLTAIGAVIGIPLTALGVLLMVRGVY